MAELIASHTLRHVQRPADFKAWRDAARAFIAAGVPPHAIDWIDTQDAATQLFAAEPTALPAPVSQRPLSLPSAVLHKLEAAACHSAADRWALLYKVLWRWAQGEHSAASPADEDGARRHLMAQAVPREIHHMHAYVRFQERAVASEGPRFVAWFEPAHNVLPQVAPHFAQRMGKVSWLIATPRASVACDGAQLQFGPGTAKLPQLDDAGEALWLAYYRNTFNPSRVNADLMRQHMPVRFWKNLPEAPLIPAMVTAAATGAKRVAQSQDVFEAVRAGGGTMVSITAERARPERPDTHKLDECRRCELWRNATHGVPGAGPAKAKVIVVGEQPGDQEDLKGQPFVGPAGKVLDHALAEAGVDRDLVYVTNAVKHFKWELRGKRRLHKTPAQQEIEACHYWLQGELDASDAKVIVALGATALKSVLLAKNVTLGKVLGQILEHEVKKIVPTYHPSYVLRLRDDEERHAAQAVIVEALRTAARIAAV
jgi:DNA polymerase